MPEKKAQTQSVRSPPPNYASLKNNANNCWFNATVQALAHGAFGDWLLGKPLRKNIFFDGSLITFIMAVINLSIYFDRYTGRFHYEGRLFGHINSQAQSNSTADDPGSICFTG